MPRTTDIAVQGIIEWDDTIPLAPFIEAANRVVTNICGAAKNEDGDPYYAADADMEIIERWLAAHFYAVRDPRNVVQGVEGLIDRFESHIDLNLNITRYGQQAMVVDTSGALATFNRTLTKGGVKRRVGVTWLGQDPDPDEAVTS